MAACKQLHVTGKDSNGLKVWGEEKDKFDLQQNRRLVSSPEELFREGIFCLLLVGRRGAVDRRPGRQPHQVVG